MTVIEGLAPWKLAAVPGFVVSPNSPQGNLETLRVATDKGEILTAFSL